MSPLIVLGYIFAMMTFCSLTALVALRWGKEYLIGLYITLLALGATLTSKIVTFGSLTFSVTTLCICCTFYITDILSELWGKKEAMRVSYIGLFALVVTFLVQKIAVFWVASPAFVQQGDIFDQVFSSNGRVILASMIASASQVIDVELYHHFLKRTGRAMLWLRNNGSTMLSQTFDTVLFVSIAFWGTMPNAVLFDVFIGIWLFKIIVAFLDTPFIYATVWIYRKYLKGRQIGDDGKGKHISFA